MLQKGLSGRTLSATAQSSAPGDAAGSDACDRIFQQLWAPPADAIGWGRYTGIAGADAAWKWDYTRGDR